MKYILTIVLFSILVSCKTEKRNETTNLSVIGQYCKYPDNDFLVLPIQLFKGERFVKNATFEFNRTVNFEDLPYGKYTIKFTSIYDREENIEFNLERKNQEITLCIDKIDYKQQSERKSLIDQLKSNERLIIDFNSIGCFYFKKSGIEIRRKEVHYFAKLDSTEVLLSPAQIELIREFEIELQEVPIGGGCTTSDTYKLSLGNSVCLEMIDDNCMWNGFNNLVQKLELVNNE